MTDLTTTSPTRFVGCDVGKRTLVVFDSHDQATRELANEPEALAAWAAELHETCLVICEATGGYETIVLDALVKAGRPVHRADARKVKAFIRSLGTLGKTDAIDARALARYGEERHDRLLRWQPPQRYHEQLHRLVMLRRDLVAQRVAFSNRLAAPGAEPIGDRLRRILDSFKEEIAGIDDDIRALIAATGPLARTIKVLQSISGIGPTTAVTLAALMPELGFIERRKATALAGLAPHPRDSGKTNGYRRTRGGRPDIKQTLFLAALAAIRHNQTLKAFYKHLCANGKKPMIAITAVMRKMIVIANAKLRDDRRPQLS
jgi:transposase